ncbi:MAG: hypothetical protein ACK484_11930 [Sphingobacteriales bacterium]|jgi:hypothetical protein
MEALKIEVLNPKALKLIKGMEDLKLIKVTAERKDDFQQYLKKMRSKSKSAPNLKEITKVVDQVRSERYAKKKNA